jgi:hypothetical protein
MSEAKNHAVVKISFDDEFLRHIEPAKKHHNTHSMQGTVEARNVPITTPKTTYLFIL